MKILPFLRLQSDDLRVYQNTISRSQGNFSEVREKSGKMKVEKVNTLNKAIKPIRSIILRTLNGEARKPGTRPTSRFQLR